MRFAKYYDLFLLGLFVSLAIFTAAIDEFAVTAMLAWMLAALFVYRRYEFQKQLIESATRLGIEVRFSSLEKSLSAILSEIERKNSSFSTNVFEKKFSSKEELSQALERIVEKAYQLLSAKSAELALYDEAAGMFHSALVMGRPVSSDSQAMLSDASSSKDHIENPQVMIQPIAFAGKVLGTLRVGLEKGRLPSTGDREVMNLLALQGGLAIINAEYTQQLLKMHMKSDESVKAKTGFLANLSHEIRGPLGIMLNAVELVLDGLCGPLTSDQLDTLRMVHGNGEHLLELVNDVLDYAKVESGRVKPNKVDILVQDLLNDLTGVVRTQAEAKKHKLDCKQATEAFAISCDRRHIRQILINMLTNAIKYTPNGGSVDIWAERVPGNKVKICVKDSGVGISAEDRPKVFEAFERIENAYSINQIGTGLGMPLTRKLAEVNGGTVDFESQNGKGSTFWVILPAVEISTINLEEKNEKIPEVKGRGELVLLMEKNEGERAMLNRFLNHVGFRVIGTSNKIEALEVLRREPLSLVIVDNDIADDANEDIVGMIRTNAKPLLPLILISSRAFAFDIERYLKSGVDRCLIKPIVMKELAYICRQLIDGTYRGEIVDKSEIEPDKAKKINSKVITTPEIVH